MTTFAGALKRLIPDRFLLVLIATVIAASLLPARGQALEAIGTISTAAIFTLFFMHGARLSHAAVFEGLKRWRLQLAILVFGYGIMPLFGLGFSQLLDGWLSPGLVLGIIFLAVLPTTVQSSIAYSSLGGGNVAGSVIAAAASNLLGVVLTPLLFAALASTQGGDAGLSAIGKIMLLLLLPFCLGQIAQRFVSGWIGRHRALVGFLDKLTIVLAVYVAFSEAVTGGIWQRVSGEELTIVVAAVTALLLLAFAASWGLGALLKKPRADRITLLFSGSHKSLATGAPMIRILFAGPEAGAILLPLILYHQLQLMLSAVIAGRLARHA
ncbi:bile acid:sodium symporter family protein [Sphingomonas sp. LaA6.9]|uniref:bile acid:sodium symporter family protein n=1 Tax=Sphingomonas sp. LaA6.9 TaxID=2919914 RepID=UPI001F4F5DF2|nr:bile acid:sodium symporter family protein [Sphingomonas sp. LaA6.9]MCJ8158098.1 bile acid:sodium symporter [Sphingomonas sp. LaA6.9]